MNRKNYSRFTCAILILLLVAGCSKEEEPPKNQTVQLNNNSNERIAVTLIGFSGDSTQKMADIRGTITSPLVRFKENNLIIEGGQTATIHNFSDQTLKRSLEQAGGLVYYVLNIDTLEQVAWEEIRLENRGVRIYFYKTYQKLEASGFTIEYP
jgi:hypothetical protein